MAKFMNAKARTLKKQLLKRLDELEIADMYQKYQNPDNPNMTDAVIYMKIFKEELDMDYNEMKKVRASEIVDLMEHAEYVNIYGKIEDVEETVSNAGNPKIEFTLDGVDAFSFGDEMEKILEEDLVGEVVLFRHAQWNGRAQAWNCGRTKGLEVLSEEQESE